MQRSVFLVGVLALALACQVMPTPPPLRATPRSLATSTRQSSYATTMPSNPQPGTTPPGNGNQTPAPWALAPFDYQGQPAFAEIHNVEWSPAPINSSAQVVLPVSLESIPNLPVASGLTSRQRVMLSQNGFVVLHSQEAQYSALRQRVSSRYGQPYYLTIDSASHALNLAMDELLPALEREELRRRVLAIIQATLDQVLSYLPLVQDGELEAETRLAAAYLGVAVRLLDPQAVLDPELETQINPQVQQALAGNGVETSVLLPGFQDNYQAYFPTGHYSAAPDLEGYFRGMTWLERVHFSFQESPSASPPSQVPLIVTLALRQAVIGSTPAAQEWARINETFTFLNGASASVGPAEIANWMDQIYGRGVTVLGLRDSSRWATFLEYTRNLPALQINPSFAMLMSATKKEQSWSFFATRFNLDDAILQSLAASQASASPEQRLQPGGLELMAVLESPAALQAMQSSGETMYRTAPKEISRIQGIVSKQSEMQWSITAHSSWLHNLQELLAAKSQHAPRIYPDYMYKPAWALKELNCALGSWVELRHRGALPARQSPNRAENNQPVSPPAPGYVEPNPKAFYRLANLAFMLSEGLKQRQMTGVFTTHPNPAGLSSLLVELLDLADRLQRLGDIAVKELAGEVLGPSDYALIQAPLGPAEARAAQEASNSGTKLQEPALPALVTLETDKDRIVQTGIGKVDRMYVLVPLEGKVYIAQGGVYSYYEFSLPRSSRLDDTAWRRMLLNDPPKAPVWTENLYIPEGYPFDLLAFRSGDIYQVKLATEQVKIFDAPRLDASVTRRLRPGKLLKIIAGPASANGFSWWQVQVDLSQPQPFEGWVVESQTSFERVWNQ